MHNFRSKDEQQAIIDRWTKSYNTFVGNFNNASADQVNDLVSSFIADSVTFGIAHKSYANIKANRPSNLIIKPAKALNNPKVPQLKIGKHEITPEKTTIIKAPASFTGKGKTFSHHSKKAPTKHVRLIQQKTSQTKSTKPSTPTNTQIQKVSQNKTTIAEQKGFKPAVEESAKKTATLDAVKKFEQKYQHYRQRFGAIAETGENGMSGHKMLMNR